MAKIPEYASGTKSTSIGQKGFGLPLSKYCKQIVIFMSISNLRHFHENVILLTA